MYSLLESCKLNNVNFGAYIEDILTWLMKGEKADNETLQSGWGKENNDRVEPSLRLRNGLYRDYGMMGHSGSNIGTPHVIEDIPNKTAHLKERFAELQNEYKGTVRLHLAAEYMLDNLSVQRLEANDLLPLGEKGAHLLVETSYLLQSSDKYVRSIRKNQSKRIFPCACSSRTVYIHGQG